MVSASARSSSTGNRLRASSFARRSLRRAARSPLFLHRHLRFVVIQAGIADKDRFLEPRQECVFTAMVARIVIHLI